MARYSLRAIERILSNYWELKDGKIPEEMSNLKGKGHKSPYETAINWVSDIDQAMDKLDPENPGRWLRIAADINERKLRAIFYKLNFRQKRLIRFYIFNEQAYYDKKAHRYIDLKDQAFRTLKQMRRILAGRELKWTLQKNI